MKNSILYYILPFLCIFISIKISSQEMVALPNGGCGRLLDTNTSSSSDGGFLCFRLGKEAINPNSMIDIDVNSFGSLKPGTGAGLFCSMYIGVGTNGADFAANKPVYIDFASDGFNFNPSFNGGNFVFYNNGTQVYSTGVNGHLFFDFGDNQERRIIKIVPTAAWDEVRLAFGEAIGIGFSFSQMRVYNILSEYYIAPMEFLSQPSDKTVSAGGSTTMTAVVNNTDEIPDNITYQWQILNGTTWTDLSNGSNYTNVTSSTLNINNAPVGFNNNQYRVVSKSSFHTCSFQAISNIARLFVNSVNNPGTIGIDQTVCLDINGNPDAFTQVSPALATGTLEYQWQSSTDNITFVNITNATSAVYDAPSITQTTYYRRGVRSVLNGNTTAYQYSNVATVTVRVTCLIKCIISNRMIYTKLK
jgi:hypothetical protein